jgi:hypothetical protein
VLAALTAVRDALLLVSDGLMIHDAARWFWPMFDPDR